VQPHRVGDPSEVVVLLQTSSTVELEVNGILEGRNTRAIRKVTFGELLKKQAMRKRCYYIQKISTYLSYFST
jgi:hypothetical protein